MKEALIVCVLLAALVGGAGPAWGAASPPNLDAFLAEWFREYVDLRPELGTSLGDLAAYGVRPRNDAWDDRSDDFRRAEYKRARTRLGYLRALDPATLTPEEQVTVETLRWHLEDLLAGEKFLYQVYVLDPVFGVQSQVPAFLTGTHPLRSAGDAEDYVKRLKGVGRLFDQVIQASEARAAKGCVPPASVIDAVASQCREFLLSVPEANTLYTHFAQAAGEVPGLSVSQRRKVEGEARTAVARVVYPAYRRLIAHCEWLRARGTVQGGVWQLPDGEAYYHYVLRSRTTSDLTPDEVHELGLREVERISSEIRGCFAELGLNDAAAELASLFRRLPREQLYGQEVFRRCHDLLAEVEPQLPALFGRLPHAAVALAPVPDMRQASVGNYYEPPSLDGSRPGVFFVNLALPNSSLDLAPLLYHETVPGHHLQLSLQQEDPQLPALRKVLWFEAFVEGWALYAERLALERGLYRTPLERLGYLQSELFRAARLVLDTGLHAKGWTREEGIDYLARLTGRRAPFEIDRYLAWPGQACAYKLGELEFRKVRAVAEARCGSAFSLREFHRVVLKNGAVPLEVLEREVASQYSSQARP